MKIQILLDKNSWAINYKNQFKLCFKEISKKIHVIDNHSKIKKNNTICVIFSYFKKIPKIYLNRSKYNLICHESNLPKGRGMSPITWQILNGKQNFIFSLIEASEKIDNGKIYFKKKVKIKKNYLFGEIKKIQFENNIKLILRFSKYLKKNNKPPKALDQKGKPTYYKLRNSKDSKININKSIKSQFNLIRSADSDKYPVYFDMKNRKFFLRITTK